MDWHVGKVAVQHLFRFECVTSILLSDSPLSRVYSSVCGCLDSSEDSNRNVETQSGAAGGILVVMELVEISSVCGDRAPYINCENGHVRLVSLCSAVASDVDISFRNKDVAIWRTLGVQKNLSDVYELVH